MEKKLTRIIKDIYQKYGKDHPLTMLSVASISPYLKVHNNEDEIKSTLEQHLEIDINELKSLFQPEKFEFEPQQIGDIYLEINSKDS